MFPACKHSLSQELFLVQAVQCEFLVIFILLS